MREGLRAQPSGKALLEDREVRADTHERAVRAQHARAKAVERSHERALELTRRSVLARVAQSHRDALAQLGRRALGERDREDARRSDAVVDHRAREALDEHRGLAAAGARREQQRLTAARDRALLRFGQLRAGQRGSAGARQHAHLSVSMRTCR